MGEKNIRKGRKNRKKGRESGLGYDDDDWKGRKDRVWAEQQKKSRENVRDFLLKFYLVIHYVCMV